MSYSKIKIRKPSGGESFQLANTTRFANGKQDAYPTFGTELTVSAFCQRPEYYKGVPRGKSTTLSNRFPQNRQSTFRTD